MEPRILICYQESIDNRLQPETVVSDQHDMDNHQDHWRGTFVDPHHRRSDLHLKIVSQENYYLVNGVRHDS